MNKKICALLLSVTMCFCFTACSGNTQTKQSTTEIAVATAETQTTSETKEESTTAETKTSETTTAEKSDSKKSAKKKSLTTEQTTKADEKGKKTTAKAKATTTAPSSKKAQQAEKKNKNGTVSCTVTVECKSILSHMDDLKEGHEEFVPSDGYIIKDYTYNGKQGDTAYDALKAACNDKDIKLTSQKTTYGIYISGINNLDEFDCGKQSGWMYRVNGKYPSTTCGNVTVSENDSIVFEYVCTYQ